MMGNCGHYLVVSTSSLLPEHTKQFVQPGVLIPVGLTALISASWLILVPAGVEFQHQVGELMGVLAIWLMSLAVLGVSDLPGVNKFLGGINGQLWWHRVIGTTGLVLAFFHPDVVTMSGRNESWFLEITEPLEKLSIGLVVWAYLSTGYFAAKSPRFLSWLFRPNYDLWRILHSALVLYVIAGAVHGLLDASAMILSPVLFTMYWAILGIGAFAILDQLLTRRLRNVSRDGTVTDVRKIGDDAVALRVATDHPNKITGGEFVYLGAKSTLERPHPFTVSGVREGELEFVIKEAGRGTRRLINKVKVGDRVSVSNPQHASDYRDGLANQVWIAGGLSGIAPFVAWVRKQGSEYPGHQVSLFWSVRGIKSRPDGPIRSELIEAAQKYDWFNFELIDTAVEDRINVAEIVAKTGVPAKQLSAHLCGSPEMVSKISSRLRKSGVKRKNVHVESFGFR